MWAQSFRSVRQMLPLSVEPGFGGQKFQAPVMEKVRQLRSKYPSLQIEVRFRGRIAGQHRLAGGRTRLAWCCAHHVTDFMSGNQPTVSKKPCSQLSACLLVRKLCPALLTRRSMAVYLRLPLDRQQTQAPMLLLLAVPSLAQTPLRQ